MTLVTSNRPSTRTRNATDTFDTGFEPRLLRARRKAGRLKGPVAVLYFLPLLTFSSGCAVSTHFVGGPYTNPIKHIRRTTLPQVPIVLGIPEVTGNFAARWKSLCFLLVVNDVTREPARVSLSDSFRDALTSYLSGSNLFEHVATVPPQENVSAFLDCELLVYEADITSHTRSTFVSSTVVETSRPTISANFVLRTRDGGSWPFSVSHSWPERTFQRAAGGGMDNELSIRGQVAKRMRAYQTEALEEFLDMVLRELEARREQLASAAGSGVPGGSGGIQIAKTDSSEPSSSEAGGVLALLSRKAVAVHVAAADDMFSDETIWHEGAKLPLYSKADVDVRELVRNHIETFFIGEHCTIVSRDRLDELFHEHELSVSLLTDDTIKRMGQLRIADVLVQARIVSAAYRNIYSSTSTVPVRIAQFGLAIQIVDTATGEVLWQGTHSLRATDLLKRSISLPKDGGPGGLQAIEARLPSFPLVVREAVNSLLDELR